MEGVPLTSLDMSPALRDTQGSNLARKSPQDKAALDRVAKEFESVFMSLLLKEMRNTLDEGFFGSESSDVLGGMFDQFLGQHLAASSPLGIQELLVAQKYAPGAFGSESDAEDTYIDNGSAGSAPVATDTSLAGETES